MSSGTEAIVSPQRYEKRSGLGTVHRMTAIEDCDVVEVSTPELDDVVRLEDRYGRSETKKQVHRFRRFTEIQELRKIALGRG